MVDKDVLLLGSIGITLLIILIIQYLLKVKYKKTRDDLKEELSFIKRELKETKLLLKEKEAALLKSSINPHLFHNALNIITSKTESTIVEAKKVISTSESTLKSIEILTNVLRYIIYESKENFVSIEKEIKFIEEYLKLQRIRVRNANFKINIDTEALLKYNYEGKLIIAPLICIDFIENAFKYADTDSPNGFINVKFELINKQLIFSVRNTKRNNIKKSISGGFGYENLIKRLELLYPNKFEIDVKDETNIFSANLKIELHEKQN